MHTLAKQIKPSKDTNFIFIIIINIFSPRKTKWLRFNSVLLFSSFLLYAAVAQWHRAKALSISEYWSRSDLVVELLYEPVCLRKLVDLFFVVIADLLFRPSADERRCG